MATPDTSPDIIASEVEHYLSEYFMIFPSLNITPDTSLIDSGIIDSTGAAELVAFLEARYEITILDNEFVPENLDSIAKISAFICRKLGVSPERVA